MASSRVASREALRSGRRGFASVAGGAAAWQRAPLGDARALPFQVTAEQARASVFQWRKEQWFSPSAYLASDRKGRLLRSAFVPFHVFETRTGRIEFSGEVGRNRLRRRFDPSTNNYKQVMLTSWSPSGLYYTDGNTYPASDAHMQLYASYRHRVSDMNILKGEHMAAAVPYTETDMISGRHSIEALTMPRKLARETVKAFVKQTELDAATEYLKTYHRADVVRNVQLTLSDLTVSTSTVYVPVYIDECYFFGKRFHVYISGIDAAVQGPRLYSTFKVAAALYAPILFFADATTPVDYTPPLYVMGSGVAALVIGKLWQLSPYISTIFSRTSYDWEDGDDGLTKLHHHLEQLDLESLRDMRQDVAARQFRDRARRNVPADSIEALRALGNGTSAADLRDTFVRLAMHMHPAHQPGGPTTASILRYAALVKLYGRMRRGDAVESTSDVAKVGTKPTDVVEQEQQSRQQQPAKSVTLKPRPKAESIVPDL